MESYFSPGAVGMQPKQCRDNEKGGLVGEEDECIISTSGEDSWWDVNAGDTTKRVSIEGTKKLQLTKQCSIEGSARHRG